VLKNNQLADTMLNSIYDICHRYLAKDTQVKQFLLAGSTT